MRAPWPPTLIVSPPNVEVETVETTPGTMPEEAGEAAVERRRVDELLGADVAADFLRRGVHERRLSLHRDRFLEPADLQRHVDRRRAADLEPHVAAAGRDGSPRACLDLVHAGIHGAEEERSVRAARRLTKGSALLMADDDRHAGHGALLGVDDASAKIGRALLGADEAIAHNTKTAATVILLIDYSSMVRHAEVRVFAPEEQEKGHACTRRTTSIESAFLAVMRSRRATRSRE